MKSPKILFFILLPLLLASCGAKKEVAIDKPVEVTNYSRPNNPEKILIEEEPEDDKELFPVIETALSFLGTNYRYGGTTDKGMDCSGLIYTSFLKQDIALPRSSRDMSLLGNRLNLDEVETGDLLFFETDKKKKVINHVGLVVELNAQKIYFIHSTTSRGVIISALDEAYWQEHFVMARRIQ